MPDSGAATAPSRLRIAVTFAAIYILWGSTYLAIRFGVETVPPFVLAGTRHLTAGLILLVWMHWRGVHPPRGSQWKGAAIVGGLMLLGGNGLVTWAEQRVPSGLTALIIASVPIWMSVMEGVEKRKRPRATVLGGLLLGVAGIGLLVAPGRLGGKDHADPLGVLALLAAAFCWSLGSLYSRRANLPSSILMATAMEMVAGGLWLWLVGLATGEGSRLDLTAVSLRSALSLGYLVVFGSLIGFTAYVWLLKVTTPARVSTYAYVNPIVAVLLGAFFAGEAITLRIALAALVIIGAVALILAPGTRAPRAPAVDAHGELAAVPGSGGGS